MTEATEIRDIPLPDTGTDWDLGEIVYTHYSYDETAPVGRRVLPTPRSYAVKERDIKRFIQQRIKRLPLPQGQTLGWRSDDPEPDRPINIYVTDPCWVVIQLDSNVDWQFEPGQPGITAQGDYGHENCDLKHVTMSGVLAGSVAPADEPCRLIYFAVPQRLRKEWDHQKFRCHIVRRNKRLDDPVDPDIPNDGGRFPFPVINPKDRDEDDA